LEGEGPGTRDLPHGAKEKQLERGRLVTRILERERPGEEVESPTTEGRREQSATPKTRGGSEQESAKRPHSRERGTLGGSSSLFPEGNPHYILGKERQGLGGKGSVVVLNTRKSTRKRFLNQPKKNFP